MTDFLKKYNYLPSKDKIDGDLTRIAENLASVRSEKALKD